MKKKILINILISTLPILVYLIADYFIKNSVYSIIIAMSAGIIEFIISLIIYKKIDLYIFVELLIILIMGIISVSFKNPLFFKLKPALIEAVLCIFIILIGFSKKVFIFTIKRYLKNIEVDNNKINEFQTILLFFIPILFIHIFLIIISSVFFSKELWAFISGGLLYIFFAITILTIILYRFFYQRYIKSRYKTAEWFDIIDEKTRIVGKAPREICHNGSKLLHPVVHVHIMNTQKKILLQKRAHDKDIQPGKWDTSIGGHIQSGEKLDKALIREVKEEAGIDINIEKLLPLSKYIFESDIEKEYVFSFIYFYDGVIKFQESEIDEVNFFTINEIKELIKNGQTTPNFIKEFELLKEGKYI